MKKIKFISKLNNYSLFFPARLVFQHPGPSEGSQPGQLNVTENLSEKEISQKLGKQICDLMKDISKLSLNDKSLVITRTKENNDIVVECIRGRDIDFYIVDGKTGVIIGLFGLKPQPITDKTDEYADIFSRMMADIVKARPIKELYRILNDNKIKSELNTNKENILRQEREERKRIT